jgi:hypothetical protein
LVIAFIIAIPLCAYALSGRISLENKSKMSLVKPLQTETPSKPDNFEVCDFGADRKEYSSFQELNSEMKKGNEQQLTQYCDFNTSQKGMELQKIVLNKSCMTVIYSLNISHKEMLTDNAELMRLLSICEISWLFTDDVNVTMDNLLYVISAYADNENPGYYFADVTRNVVDKHGNQHAALVGKQVVWEQDGALFCAYYPISMTNSEMAKMSCSKFVNFE